MGEDVIIRVIQCTGTSLRKLACVSRDFWTVCLAALTHHHVPDNQSWNSEWTFEQVRLSVEAKRVYSMLCSIIAIGGETTGVSQTAVESLIPTATSWERVPLSLEKARHSFAACCTPDGVLWVTGGRDGKVTLDSVEVFDVKVDDSRWISGPPLISPRWGHGKPVLSFREGWKVAWYSMAQLLWLAGAMV